MRSWGTSWREVSLDPKGLWPHGASDLEAKGVTIFVSTLPQNPGHCLCLRGWRRQQKWILRTPPPPCFSSLPVGRGNTLSVGGICLLCNRDLLTERASTEPLHHGCEVLKELYPALPWREAHSVQPRRQSQNGAEGVASRSSWSFETSSEI